MGSSRTNLVSVGCTLNKTEFIVSRTAPNQICISKECYEALAQLNIPHNIIVKETVKIENVYENVFELLDKKK